MSLAPGVRLGAYEIVSLLGAGGMGEVYRARDTRLGREVAVKILPAAFSSDPERLRRFEQESRAAAALTHPNILAVHDIGTQDGAPFIVSELLAGETLRQKVANGPVPPRKAVDYAIQIAHGLAAAHERAIVHRDLKPDNIFICDDGRVKILDFGLAKLTQPDAPLAVDSNLPTSPFQGAGDPITQRGTLLGTLGYMAPEQVRGLAVDHRADIFAFGAVLYEMSGGRRAFTGETPADTISAILKEDPPDLPIVERRIPPALARIIDRCLEKNPVARFHSTHDLALALETLSSHSESVISSTVAPRVTPSRAWLPWALFAGAAACAMGAAAWALTRPVADTPTYHATLLPPEGIAVTDVSPSRLFAISPDGRRLAFIGVGTDRRRLLWVRSLDGPAAQALAGTEGAIAPFWSPDSRHIGFFTLPPAPKLKRIAVEGGPPITLCDITGGPAGADWNRDGVILFTTTGAGGGPIRRVSAAGGSPSEVLTPDSKTNEREYFWPFFLPDGQHFLYLAMSNERRPIGIFTGTLDSTDRKLVLKGGSNTKYANGRILFLRGTTLMAQRFNTDRLEVEGEASPVAEQIRMLAPTGAFSVSQNGVLVYSTGENSGVGQLTWFDAEGRQAGTVGDVGPYADLRLSPDGKRGAVTLLDSVRGTRDVWIVEISRGLLTRFTFDAADDIGPIWSPDGEQIVFSSNRSGHGDLWMKPASGAAPETLLFSDSSDKSPLSWSPDGKYILYAAPMRNPPYDVWVLPLADRKPYALTTTPFNEVPAVFSRDGRWVAFTSNESGRPEIYVVPFPPGGGKWQISSTGGVNPVWTRDGKEIIYSISDGRFMTVPLAVRGTGLEIGAARQIFTARQGGPRSFFDIAPDNRLLVNVALDRSEFAPITLVVNWAAALKN